MSARILVAGDFCPQGRVEDCIQKNDYVSVLGDVRGVLAQMDYSIVNYECPIIKGSEKPIMKSGPCLKSTKKGLEMVKWAGFDCVTLANNHFLDYGELGARNTLEACRDIGLDYVGGGMNLADASKVSYKVINAQRLAIINCCENEFSIATDNNAGSNPLNPVKQFYQVREARANADYVLVIVHGGSEFYQLPTPRMQDTYRFFIDAGADAVVNHHQHCLSGYEVYNNCPIFYGLGNFCFDRKDKRDDSWNKGYMVQLYFDKCEHTKFDIIAYEQCNHSPIVHLVKNSAISETIESLNKIISNRTILEKKFTDFVNETKDVFLLAMEPYIGHWGGLRKRKLIPSLLSKTYYLRLYGYLKCEAHYDRMTKILKDIIYG